MPIKAQGSIFDSAASENKQICGNKHTHIVVAVWQEQ